MSIVATVSATAELFLVIGSMLQIKQSTHQVLVHHARKYTALYNLGRRTKYEINTYLPFLNHPIFHVNVG